MKLNIIKVEVLRNYTARKEIHEHREFLVAPVIILTEGVHCGSGGCFLYTSDELEKFPAHWNNRPLPVFHPTNPDGTPVSANDPAVIEAESVGHLFNVRFEVGKLIGEVWIDKLKAQNNHPVILSTINKGEPLEVSTGLFSDKEGPSGEWNGEQYEAKAVNIRSDHLALLPGSKGACSLQDGCGVRANAEGVVTEIDKSKVINAIKVFAKNQIAHEDVRQQLQKEMDRQDVIRPEPGSSTLHFVLAVFDTFFIYRKESPDEALTFKQNYTVSNSNEIKLGEEAKEVREKVTFIEVNEDKTKGGHTMCPKKVKALIDNEDTKWTKDDKEFLESLDDKMAEKILTVVEKEVPAVLSKEDQKTLDDAKEAKTKAETEAKNNKDKGAKEVTLDELLEKDPGKKSALAYGEKMMKEQTDKLIKVILANAKNKFEEKDLEKKEIAELEMIANLAEVPADYSGAGGPIKRKVDANKAGGTPLKMPEMYEEKKEVTA